MTDRQPTADSKKILIIDDQLNILKTLRRILEEHYSIKLALGAQEALEILEQGNHTFRAILCDCRMPTMSGEDFYNAIVKNHSELERRIIFMSGGEDSPFIQKFAINNKDRCLLKPFKNKELFKAIENVMINSEGEL